MEVHGPMLRQLLYSVQPQEQAEHSGPDASQSLGIRLSWRLCMCVYVPNCAILALNGLAHRVLCGMILQSEGREGRDPLGKDAMICSAWRPCTLCRARLQILPQPFRNGPVPAKGQRPSWILDQNQCTKSESLSSSRAVRGLVAASAEDPFSNLLIQALSPYGMRTEFTIMQAPDRRWALPSRHASWGWGQGTGDKLNLCMSPRERPRAPDNEPMQATHA